MRQGLRQRLLAVFLSLAAALGAVSASACYGDDDGRTQQDGGGGGDY
jgi:hypothetical protein